MEPHDGVQADVELLVFLNRSPSDLSPSPCSQAEGDWSTDRPEAFLPQFLHACQEVVGVELASVLLSEDLDVLHSILLLQLGQLGQSQSDENVTDIVVVLLRAGPDSC